MTLVSISERLRSKRSLSTYSKSTWIPVTPQGKLTTSKDIREICYLAILATSFVLMCFRY